jgi:hypothetical protein
VVGREFQTSDVARINPTSRFYTGWVITCRPLSLEWRQKDPRMPRCRQAPTATDPPLVSVCANVAGCNADGQFQDRRLKGSENSRRLLARKGVAEEASRGLLAEAVAAINTEVNSGRQIDKVSPVR